MNGYISRAEVARVAVSKRLWPVVLAIYFAEQDDDVLGVGIDEIAEAISVDRGDTAHRVAMLRKSGLVDRVQVSGRRALYTLTDTASYIATMIIYPPDNVVAQ